MNEFLEQEKIGRLVIMSGPSGVGKSTIRDLVLKEAPVPLKLSVSATTRPARPGERHGEDYYFLTEQEFSDIRNQDGFLEYVEVYERVWYGTLVSEVLNHLHHGMWVMLEIDVDGAIRVMERFPTAISVYIRPESLSVLEQRLRNRGTEDEATIKRRLDRARYEMEKIGFYKYVITNITVSEAVKEFNKILKEEAA